MTHGSVIARAKREMRGRWHRYVKMPIYGLVARRSPDSKMGRRYRSHRRHQAHDRITDRVGARTQPYDLLLFGIIDWHSHFQRPQQLSRQFARMGYRVFYLEPSIHYTPDTRLVERGYSLVDSPEPNVFLCQLHSELPRLDFCRSPMGEEHRQALARGVANLRSAHELHAVVSIVEHPFWRPLTESLPASFLVYDCLDHIAGFSHCTPAMRNEESRLLGAARLVVTTSAALADQIAPRAQNLLVRNGADFGFFSQRPGEIRRPSNRPVVGYFGAVEDWFDMGLVKTAARALPAWDFWLIGPASEENLVSAKGTPNILYAGKVPYAELPKYLYGMDVCMIPFVENELTRCTNPIKVYEYLAAGKPVVATWMPELELIREHVRVSRSASDFISNLRAAMADTGTPIQVGRRMAWAAQQDWSARAQAFQDGIHRTFPELSRCQKILSDTAQPSRTTGGSRETGGRSSDCMLEESKAR